MSISRKKVADAFEEGNPEYRYADTYLAELRSGWNEIEKSISRSGGLTVVLAIIFELLYANKASTTTFFTIKLTSINVVLLSFPIIISYLYYTVSQSIVEAYIFDLTHRAVLKKVYPALAAAGGESQITPAGSLVGASDRITAALESEQQPTRLAGVSGDIRPLTVMFGPPIFIIVIYVQLFLRYNITDGLLWGSLAGSTIFLAFSCINLYTLSLT